MKKLKLTLILLLITGITHSVFAQKEIIQFSGLVVAGDSLFGLQGVNIINKNAIIGFITSESGYFSFPAKAQDTILFSFVGFKNQYIVIPSKAEDNKFTQIVELIVDVTQLELIEVFPYPTVELFKQAFVHLELPENKWEKNMNQNLDQRKLRKMFENMDMTASMNYKNYTQEQIKRFEQPNFIATTQLFNPFAWIQFIKAIKNGDFKQEED